VTRVALLTEIPAPFRIPLFNALSDRLDLTVLFLRARNPERPYRMHAEEIHFTWQVLPGRDFTVRNRWLVLNWGVVRALRRAKPDVVILGGWNQPAFLLALAWARAHRIKSVAWVESTNHDRRSGRFDRAKPAALRRFDGFIVPGASSFTYLRDLGVPADRITVAPNAVDTSIFTMARKPEGGPVRILGVGRLAREKGFDLLIRAAADLPAELVLAGSGPEETRLRALAGPNVQFLGYVDRDELPALYATADVLAAPSRSEPWGMALNEGALAGLPLVSTEATGAAHDLIEDGKNGFRIPPDDVEALEQALRLIVEDEAFRTSAGERSREIGTRFTPDAWAEAISSAASRLVA
jgi:glycosyltransferase involved in cell wall biosynthesis